MSWQAYVDDHMVATKQVAKAAILGLDGSQWAVNAGFTLDPSEAAAAATAAANVNSAAGKSLVFNGTKFMVLRTDEGNISTIYGRKGSEGFCIAKTKQAVLIGLYDESMQAGQCNAVVEKLADYLAESGY